MEEEVQPRLCPLTSTYMELVTWLPIYTQYGECYRVRFQPCHRPNSLLFVWTNKASKQVLHVLTNFKIRNMGWGCVSVVQGLHNMSKILATVRLVQS